MVSACTTTQPPSHSSSITKVEIREKTQELVLKNKTRKLEQLENLSNLSWPIVSRNLEICGNHRMYSVGLRTISEFDFPKGSEALYKRSFLFDGKPVVQFAVEGSPSHDIGIKKGDQIVAVGNLEYQPNSTKATQFGRRAKSELRKLTRQGKPFPIKFSRVGKIEERELIPVEVCKFALEINDSSTINAFTDGYRISFNQGLLNLSDDDRFLQAVFAHELAHGIHKHPIKIMPRAAVGLVLDLGLLAQRIYSGGFFASVCGGIFNKEFEREADYVAYYLLANAGIEISDAVNGWEDIAVRFRGGDKKSRTHPSYAERLVIQEKIVQEIQAKMEAGEPLIPNR